MTIKQRQKVKNRKIIEEIQAKTRQDKIEAMSSKNKMKKTEKKN